MTRVALAGLRLALSTFTVLPVPLGSIDRRVGRAAMVTAPLVGALLGAVLGTAAVGLRAAGASALLAAAVTVVLEVLLTRALHMDGIADTADALGSYRSGTEALAIMKRSDIGPFGVAAIVLVLLVEVSALVSILTWSWPHCVLAMTAIGAAGRLAVTAACSTRVPAARKEGLGAMVASTVGPVQLAAASLLVMGLAVPVVAHRPWQGPLAVFLALIGVAALVRQATRRFGGVTGDVLGASVEVATVVVAVTLALS